MPNIKQKTDFLALSQDSRNERLLEKIINPETRSTYTDSELQDAIANGEAREDERLAVEAAKEAKTASKAAKIEAAAERLAAEAAAEAERIAAEQAAALGTVVPTGTNSHGGRYAGEPLVVWTPPNQLTGGYNSITVAEAVVPFHAAVPRAVS